MSGAAGAAPRRVVVTAADTLSCLGGDADTMFRHLVEGRSGITGIPHFDAAGFASQVVGVVRESPARIAELDEERGSVFKTLPRGAQLGVATGLATARRARLDQVSGARLGVCVGTSGPPLELDYLERMQRFLDSRGRWDRSRYLADPEPAGMLADHHHLNRRGLTAAVLAGWCGAGALTATVSSTCASGTQAVGEAYHTVLEGDADAVLAVGCDSLLSFVGVASFDLLSALSRRGNAEPHTASRPFDRRRDGFVIAEGAGAVVLESLEHARRRGAAPLGEVIGYGTACDAYRITDSPPDGNGAQLAMSAALESAGMEPGDVDYINAHGTSTLVNDRAETHAVRQVFGAAADGVPLSSQKSMMGHAIAGAGAIEFVTCLRVIEHAVIPPTVNYEQPDPECDLDYVPGTARHRRVRVAMSNSFGFGGQNGSLVLREPPAEPASGAGGPDGGERA